MNGVNGHANGVNGHVNGINGHATGVNGHAESGSQPKPSLRLSFTEYRRISNLLVLHLRRAEEGKRCPPSYYWKKNSNFHTCFVFPFFFFFIIQSNLFTDICVAAEEEEELKKSAVVNWYLKEIESEIDTEEELVNKKGLIEKVLHRLVHYVSPQSAKTQPLVSNQLQVIFKPIFGHD